MTGFAHGAPAPQGNGAIWLATGVAPFGVERVQVTLGARAVESEVEPITGAFVVALAAGSDEWPSLARADVVDITKSGVRSVGPRR